jgi:3-keto-5-aminohexanoate cleavage enzyme
MSTIITVATTGPIATKKDNPNLPTQPEEIAVAVKDAYDAGASVAHLHFRGKDDEPTADMGIARQTIELIRDRCPILIQVSTGVGLAVPFEEREALVELRPEMATLNPCSMSFGVGEFLNPPAGVERLAGRMQELGIQPELEIYDTGHLDAALRLRDKGLVDEHLQFSIVLGVRGGMAATPANLLLMVERLPEGCVWQVIAIGRENLRLTAIGLALSGNARAGLEDTLYAGKGELATSNAQLIQRTAGLVRSLGGEVASVVQARRTLLDSGPSVSETPESL